MPPHLDTQNIIRLFSYVHLTKSHKHRSAKEHRGSLLVLESPRGDSGLSSVKSPCDTCCPQHHLAHTVSPETLLSSLEQLKAAFSGTPGRIRLRVEKVHTQNVLSGIRYVPPPHVYQLTSGAIPWAGSRRSLVLGWERWWLGGLPYRVRTWVWAICTLIWKPNEGMMVQ